MIKAAAAEVGGGGGGRPTMARAGGKNPEKLDDALAKAEEALREALSVKVVALDYGSARTGVAVSDPTGTIARPLGVVERAATEAGLARVAELVREQGAERIVVGLPLTLRGERGAQARETEAFVEALREAVEVPVESYDERFTTGLAASVGSDDAPEDARAAAHLLSSYLAWSSAGRSDAAAAPAAKAHSEDGGVAPATRRARRPGRGLPARLVRGGERGRRRKQARPDDDDRRGATPVPGRLPRRLHPRADGGACRRGRGDRPAEARKEGEAVVAGVPGGDAPAAPRARFRPPSARGLPLSGDLRLHGAHDVGPADGEAARGVPAQLGEGEPRATRARRT